MKKTKNKLHGFKTDEDMIYDYILMDVPKSEVKAFAKIYTHKEYLEYKLTSMEKAMKARINNSNYLPEEQEKIVFTDKAIKHTRKLLKEISDD